MKTYIIDIEGKKYTRKADGAHAAICRLCDQYGWRKGSWLVDAQTYAIAQCELARMLALRLPHTGHFCNCFILP